MHVDEFIDECYCEENYARWVLNSFRLPAVLQADFKEFMKGHKLFCTYNGKRMRCTGASRMGDVWLTTDFEQEVGYELRVDVADCSKWGATPDLGRKEVSDGQG